MIIHPIGMMRADAGAGPSDPAGDIATLLGAKAKGVYDPMDWSTLWQDTAGTTAVTAAGQAVRRIDDLSGTGNHILATSGNAISAVGHLNWNNARFEIATFTDFASGMEFYTLMDPNGDTLWINLGRNAQTGFYAVQTESGSSSTAISGGFAGTKVATVDNVASSPQSRGQIHSDVSAGGFKALGIQDISIPVSGLLVLGYDSGTAYFSGNVRLIVFSTTLTSGERSDLQTIFNGAK